MAVVVVVVVVEAMVLIGVVMVVAYYRDPTAPIIMITIPRNPSIGGSM